MNHTTRPTVGLVFHHFPFPFSQISTSLRMALHRGPHRLKPRLRAYPNYFADTKFFIEVLRSLVR